MEIKNINEEDFFGNVKPGARVHYLTPQGQTRSGTVVINKGSHLVLNAGGRHGQPAVVTPKNYVKHSQGGKVQGALLSNLAKSMKEAKEPRAFRNIEDETPILPHVIGMHVLRNKPEHEYSEKKVMQYAKHVNSKFKKDDSFRKKVLSNAKGGNAGRDFLYNYAHKFYDDMLPKTNEAHNLPRTGNDELKDMGTPPGKAEFPRMPELEKQFLTKQQKVNALKRKFGYGPVTPVKEDAEEINEISKKTKDSYIAKRGSQLSSFLYGRKQDMTGRQQKNAVHGLKRATGKPVGLQAIASFAKEDAQLDAQKSALAYTTKMQKKKKKRTLKTMKEDLLSELSGETLSRYVTKAIADRKGQASMADMAHRIHTPERAKYFADKAAAKIAKRNAGIKTAVGKIASNLPHAEPLAAHTAGEKSKHGGWSGMEGRESEYRANMALSRTTPRREPGHYLTRDGRTLSGPHSPQDAVRKYKDMSDSKNVKIVHIKEAVNKDKAKKAVEKAIAFGKNAKKKGKTANVEPELTVPSSHMSQPVLQGSEGAPQNVRI